MKLFDKKRKNGLKVTAKARLRVILDNVIRPYPRAHSDFACDSEEISA